METVLVQLLDVVSRKRFLIERECELLQDLLKPWKTKNSTTPTPVSVGKEVAAPNPETEVLSSSENQVLLEADQLLAKAEKARQLKLKKKMNHQHSGDVSSDLSSRSEKSKHEIRPTPAPQSSTPTSTEELKTKTTKKQQVQQSKRVDHAQPRQNQSQPMQRVDSGRSSSASAQTTERRRPSSSASQRPSSRGRVTPAHMSAPFKTEPNIKVPHRKSQQAAKNQLKTSRTKPATRHGLPDTKPSLPTYKSLPRISHKSGMTDKSVQHQTSREKVSEVKSTNDENTVLPEDVVVDGSSDLSSTPCEWGDMNQNAVPHELSSHSGGDFNQSSEQRDQNVEHFRSQRDDSRSEPASTEQEDCFDLKKDGSSLKIPVKLRKLITSNSSLREKCKGSRIIKKVVTEHPAETFVTKLESQWVVGPELRTRIAALTCLRRHEILLEAFKSLQLDSLSESSSADDVYRAKVILEFILSKFAELEEEASILSKVQFKDVEDIHCVSTPVQNSPRTQWINVKDVASEDPHPPPDSWAVDEALSCSPLWQHLTFTEQYLHSQIQLINCARMEWESHMDVEDRDPLVTQLIYGLTTTCGQFFPTFVESQDTS